MTEQAKFEVDSYRVADWLNLCTEIRNHIAKDDMFIAGHTLCYLQQCLVDVMKELEKQERVGKSQ